MKKVTFIALISIFIILMNPCAHATESVWCGNDKIEIFVYYHLSDMSYSSIVLHVNNEMAKSEWDAKTVKTDFKKKIISLKAIQKSGKPRPLQLRVKKNKGTLKYNGKSYKVKCDWSPFSQSEAKY